MEEAEGTVPDTAQLTWPGVSEAFEDRGACSDASAWSWS